jgi:hypothetical protein
MISPRPPRPDLSLARVAGQVAFLTNLMPSDCPILEDDKDHVEWLRGWEDEANEYLADPSEL